MRIETEGIVLKQTKPVGGRSILSILTEDHGKISCGANLGMKGKNRTNLAVSPFTHASYSLFRNRGSYNLAGAEVIKSYYSIGEDVDKYMAGARILELTDRFLAEGEKAPAIFSLVIEYLDELAEREKDFGTLNIAFEFKALRILGVMPVMSECVSCGSDSGMKKLDIAQGGRICEKCYKNAQKSGNSSLIYDMTDDIVKVVEFLVRKPLAALKKLTLQDSVREQLEILLNAWIAYHLDIGDLRSESIKL